MRHSHRPGYCTVHTCPDLSRFVADGIERRRAILGHASDHAAQMWRRADALSAFTCALADFIATTEAFVWYQLCARAHEDYEARTAQTLASCVLHLS